MFKASIFILLVSLAFSKARILVPSINAENSGIQDFSLESSDGRYDLLINHENGYRRENVEEVAPGELLVRGEHHQRFKNSTVLIIYEAGRNGYLATFNIGKIGVIDKKLSAKALQSSAG